MPAHRLCTSCGRPAQRIGQRHDKSMGGLCAACADRLTTDLEDAPRLYAETNQALSPGGTQTFVRRSTNRPSGSVPVREQVVEARSGLRSVLAGWSGLVADERRVRRPDREVAALARFLRRHLLWLAAHPASGDLAREVHDAVEAARRCLRPDDTRRVHLGCCRVSDCPGDLIAYVQPGGSGLPSRIECDRSSSHRWGSQQWHLFIRRSA
jgi:hypothetical protein